MFAVLRRQSFKHRAEDVARDPTKASSGVSGVIRPRSSEALELADACVRFVATRYRVTLDFAPETLSLLDQWLRDGRADLRVRSEATELLQSAAGAYLGEVIRRQFGGHWVIVDDVSKWRLLLSTVYCAFNPVGMAREALLLEPAPGWHAHFELDPGEAEAVEARIATLFPVAEEEYYAPTTRYDVLSIIVDSLRDSMRRRGLDGVRFTPKDYPGCSLTN
jgi:hypothetical protein